MPEEAVSVVEEPRFADYEKLIWKECYRSWNIFGRPGNLPVDELFAQGTLVFCNCLRLWERNRGAFSTLLVTALRTKLIKFARWWARLPKTNRPEFKPDGLPDGWEDSGDRGMAIWGQIADPHPGPDARALYSEAVERLGSTSKLLVRVITGEEDPPCPVGGNGSYNSKTLRKALGITLRKWRVVRKEIRGALGYARG